VIAASLFAFIGSARSRAPRLSTRKFRWIASAGMLTIVVVLSLASTAATGHWFYDGYLLDIFTAHREAARGLLVSDKCRVCFSSRARAIDWTDLEPNPARGTVSSPHIEGGTMTMDVAVEGEGPWTGFGRVRVDFGDQSVTKWTGVVGQWQVAHLYRQPGEYAVSVWLQLRDGEVRVERQTIKIGG
jgi:hypothetical protein